MKKAARRIIVSVFALAISLSLAITSTFAWFTMTSTPIVDELSINVTTSEGLEISLEGGSFKPRISTDEIMEYLFGTGEAYGYAGKYSEFELTHATSEFGRAFTDMLGGSIDDGDGAYLELVINFQSNFAQDVYLNNNTNLNYVTSSKPEGAVTTPVVAWKAITDGEYTDTDIDGDGFAIDDVITGVQAANAVRISFDTGADIDGDYKPVIWYPNPDKGYNKDTNYLKAEGAAFIAKNLALDYYNSNTGGDDLTLPTYYNQTITEGEDEEEVTYNGISNYSMNFYTGNFITQDKLLTLAKVGEATKFTGTLTIRIWIEGYDGDCFDAIFDDVIKVGLQFKGEMV